MTTSTTPAALPRWLGRAPRTATRTLAPLLALVRLELVTMVHYRWWLVALQVSGLALPMVSLLAWRGAIAGGADAPVSAEFLTTYLVGVSLVTLATSSWTSTHLADSIRLGTLNAWLVRPCSTHLAAVANNLAEKLAKFLALLPLALALGVLFRADLRLPADPTRWALFAVALAGGAVLAFCLDVLIGSLAFWVQDVAGFDRFRLVATRLLSGAVVPLAVLPSAWQPFLDVQPLRYLVAFPLEVLLGDVDDDVTGAASAATAGAADVGWLAVWVVLVLAAAVVTWRRGLRRYQGAGA